MIPILGASPATTYFSTQLSEEGFIDDGFPSATSTPCCSITEGFLEATSPADLAILRMLSRSRCLVMTSAILETDLFAHACSGVGTRPICLSGKTCFFSLGTAPNTGIWQ